MIEKTGGKAGLERVFENDEISGGKSLASGLLFL
jgi:hypothetical protein